MLPIPPVSKPRATANAKRCIWCKQLKRLSCFHTTQFSIDGYRAVCRTCIYRRFAVGRAVEIGPYRVCLPPEERKDE